MGGGVYFQDGALTCHGKPTPYMRRLDHQSTASHRRKRAVRGVCSAHGAPFRPFVYPPPLPHCASTGLSKRGVGVEPLFSGFLGPLFCVVLDAGLGVCDALVEGKRGSFMSVIVHSVHNNIVPHIATPCSLFGWDFRPRLSLLFPARLSHTMLCCCVCRVQAQACLSMGWALSRWLDWTFGTMALLAQGEGVPQGVLLCCCVDRRDRQSAFCFTVGVPCIAAPHVLSQHGSGYGYSGSRAALLH